jgi:hypothetical protein
MFCISNKSREGQTLFPLFVKTGEQLFRGKNDTGWRPNLGVEFSKSLKGILGSGASVPQRELSENNAHEAMWYIYALLHSETYRVRYTDLLKMDYPRLPLTGNLELFTRLAQLGGELSELHLMETPRLGDSTSKVVGRSLKVEKLSHSRNTVWIDRAQTTGFAGIPESVWSFQIGGFQVCEKWLKDRKGRTLTDGDVAHYSKIVASLSETIRLMSEIDVVIRQYGGWPGAFAGSP